MKHFRLFLPLVVAAVAVSYGTARARADGPCPQTTNVVFYSTDTAILANALGAAAAPCTDYWISITPTGTGAPRGGLPLTTIHALGPHFHALAEIRPTTSAASTDWFATGVAIRAAMRTAGYTANDAWAINEIGTPSSQQLAKDIFGGVGQARQNFRDWVRGLYTGDGTPDAGLVFAANPAQYTADISSYVSTTPQFYRDTPFWQDMSKYVSFWAQETYADARSAGSAADLEDYFLHASRLAAEGNDDTAAAREFFSAAYAPLGNASYRYGIPDPSSPGPAFGYTDIGLPGMLHFISAQTYALRLASPSRFGYAVSPTTGTSALPTTAADRLATYQQTAAAIRDSAVDPLGACTAAGESCDVPVAGVTPPNWRALANTQEGRDVTVSYLTFDTVTARGATWYSTSTATAPNGYTSLGPSYAFGTTATTSGPVQVCLPSTGARYPHVFHDGVDITTSAGCGTASSLAGTFTLGQDATAPVVTPTVVGTQGAGGWYTSDVVVSWDVADAQSPVTTEGCASVQLTEDTPGTTYTCTATSDGGTTSVSITVKRDATAPAVTCSPTPATLWPPNGKLVPVDITVTVSDPTSGGEGYVRTVLLRATKDAVYTLTYTAHDAAGNTATCDAIVTVPHDQRG